MLFEVEPEFKSHFHGCIDQLEQVAQTVSGLSQAIPSLREGNAGDWLGTALFAAQYATYQMWRAWGITPDALFGVSLGEFVAATISGVITAEDGLHAVAYSDYLANRFPAGSSVAVGMGEDLLRGTLPDGVFVAVSASPTNHYFWETLALATFSEGLAKKGVAVHPEVAEAPFHSPLMAPWVDELIQPLRDMPLGQVRIPYISCVTGNWVQNSEVNEITHYRQLFEGESKIMTGFEQLMEWIGSEEAILLEGSWIFTGFICTANEGIVILSPHLLNYTRVLEYLF